MAAFSSMLGSLFHREREAADGGESRRRASEMYNIKAGLLREARGDAEKHGNRPDLEHYRLACERFKEGGKGREMAANNEWSPKAYADLSGLDLSGFSLSDPNKRPATDLMNLDGDGAISDFYANISFHNANLNNTYVAPATSFNEEIAQAGNLDGLKFIGMKDGEIFNFNGHYSNITLDNFKGGTINIAGGVDGLNIEGGTARISLGANAVVNNINVSDDFRILKLTMGRDSVISGDLKQSTLSMACSFEKGATFRNVTMSGNLNGLDFSGLTLQNVKIDGVAIKSAAQLENYGVAYDPKTTTVSASPSFINECAMKCATAAALGAGTILDRAIKDINPPARNPSDEPRTAQSVGHTIISGGQDVTLDNISLTNAVASLGRTVPVNEQASGANMTRSDTIA